MLVQQVFFATHLNPACSIMLAENDSADDADLADELLCGLEEGVAWTKRCGNRCQPNYQSWFRVRLIVPS